MPRRNAMGPMGFGPMTGRGLGYCIGYRASNPVGRMGSGFGWRRGSGRPMFDYSLETQEEILMRQKDVLEAQLEFIKKQLEKDK